MEKLISMTDFVLKRAEKSILPLTIEETFKNGAKITNEIFDYAKFLKRPIELGMFIPVDEDGEVLYPEYVGGKEVIYDSSVQDYMMDKVLEYNEAKEKVLFDGFKSISRFKITSGFEEISILKYNNGNTQVYVTDFTQEEPKEYLCYTIEDLIQFNLKLSDNAKNKI